MADQVHHLHSTTGTTLYMHVRNSAGAVWNGSAFETYDSGRWSFYDVAFTEQASSFLYAVAFPSGISAGVYSAVVYEQATGSPALGDIPSGSTTLTWDGTNVDDQSGLVAAVAALNDVALADILAGVLTNPALPITADASGFVTTTAATNTAIGTAVWATSVRTLSTYGTLVADVATAVWGAGTRTLTSYGTLVADVATAVWGATTRTLSAFGFTVDTTNGATIVATTNKLDDTLEDDGGTYRFTTNALEQAPDSGDATEAKQDTMIADVAALNDPTAAVIADAVWDEVLDTDSARVILKKMFGRSIGKATRTVSDPLTIEYYAQDNSTLLFTITHQNDGSARAVS